MDSALSFLTEAALRKLRERLAADPEYLACQAEEERLRAQLRRRYPGQVRRAILAAVDAQEILSAIETERAFLLGLELGLSAGRLSALPETQ